MVPLFRERRAIGDFRSPRRYLFGRKPQREFQNAIENLVREQIGYPKIGDAWVSETMLYHIVEEIYPDTEIIRHHRPNWLEGLELDIYIPSKKLAFEYQGLQHFQAVEHWGGKEKLKY